MNGFRKWSRGAGVAILTCGLPSANAQTIPNVVLDSAFEVASLDSQLDAGSYLAARAADRAHDFGAASEWFLRALADDPRNPHLLEECIGAMVGMGVYDRAQGLATRLAVTGAESQLAHIVLMANAAGAGNWTAVQAGLAEGQTVSPLIDALAQAWALVAQEEEAAALAAFDGMIANRDMVQFGIYHKALALMVMGDLAGADAILSGAPENGLPYTRRSIIAHAQILSHMGETPRAIAELARFGTAADATIVDMRRALVAGETLPLDLVGSPAEGLAEGYYNVARLLGDGVPEDFVLTFARTAQRLHPGEAEYMMLTGALLDKLGRDGLATEVYRAVPDTDPMRRAADFARADVLRRSGAPQEAAAILRLIVAASPELAVAHAELADILRGLGERTEALGAYSRAIELLPDDDSRLWRIRFMRGVTAYDEGDWTAAEADLRAAYSLNPDDAGLLNFLGYSLVERGENLEEALDMIERAVDAEPESGAIVDSYGWALFRLGRNHEAVVPMERAVRLSPENAVINDHLGDVYWSVGRILEAHFQWQRALSFATDEEERAAIRAKLDHGLVTEARAMEGAGQDL